MESWRGESIPAKLRAIFWRFRPKEFKWMCCESRPSLGTSTQCPTNKSARLHTHIHFLSQLPGNEWNIEDISFRNFRKNSQAHTWCRRRGWRHCTFSFLPHHLAPRHYFAFIVKGPFSILHHSRHCHNQYSVHYCLLSDCEVSAIALFVKTHKK